MLNITHHTGKWLKGLHNIPCDFVNTTKHKTEGRRSKHFRELDMGGSKEKVCFIHYNESQVQQQSTVRCENVM